MRGDAAPVTVRLHERERRAIDSLGRLALISDLSSDPGGQHGQRAEDPDFDLIIGEGGQPPGPFLHLFQVALRVPKPAHGVGADEAIVEQSADRLGVAPSSWVRPSR